MTSAVSSEYLLPILPPVTARQVKRSGLERRNCAVAQFLKQLDVSAMWDTGSMVTCVSKRLARYLGLASFESIPLTSLYGTSLVNVCFMDIVLPDGISIKNIKVTEIETPNDFDIIIGMNIIRLGDFALCNDHGNTVMTFSLPTSNTPIDSMKEE
jgi:hypothetical protein